MSLFLIAVGLVLLVLGGDVLVRGAVGLATRLGVSPLMIGLTVVGFGTSMPELVTSLQATFAGAPGIALGNVIGSNTANILLILGLAALIRAFPVDRSAFRRDGVAMALAALVALALTQFGGIGRLAGGALVGALAVYLVMAYRLERGPQAPETTEPAQGTLSKSLFTALAGIALTIAGARLLVDGATDLARAWGVSEAVIGLTLVAIGTSLPELVTSVIAAVKGRSDIALGNVLGSNIYNILGILGITALARPIPVDPQIAGFDAWVMVAATLALLAMMRSGWRISRSEGALMLAAYAGYIGWLGLSA